MILLYVIYNIKSSSSFLPHWFTRFLFYQSNNKRASTPSRSTIFIFSTALHPSLRQVVSSSWLYTLRSCGGPMWKPKPSSYHVLIASTRISKGFLKQKNFDKKEEDVLKNYLLFQIRQHIIIKSQGNIYIYFFFLDTCTHDDAIIFYLWISSTVTQ